MFDAALHFGQAAKSKSNIVKDLRLDGEKFAYFLHRAENVDSEKRLKWLVGQLNEVSKDLSIILPVHPRLRARLDAR